jgi:hypothetical protein
MGNPKTNVACTEKAKRLPTQMDRFVLMLTLMVKVILPELQFLDPSHVGVCLVGYRAYLLDVRYGEAVGHSSQKSRVVISHFKGMSGVPKRVSGQNTRNTGWSKVLLTGYDHRAFVVTKSPLIGGKKSLLNGKDIVKGGSQLGYTGGRNVSGRWTGIQKPSYVVRSWAFHTDHVSYHVNLFKRSISPASVLGLACSMCGGEYRVEMHHIRQLKNIKAGKSLLDKLMMQHRRKQIPLCRKCHMEAHQRKVL